MLPCSSATVIGTSSSYSAASSSMVLSIRVPGASDPKANTPPSVRVNPAWILPSPGTSRSPFSSWVTESGTVTTATRLTSG